MATPEQKPDERLCIEILAEAQAARTRIRDGAHHEAAAILAKAGDEAEQVGRECLEHATTEAARRKERILATVPVQAARLHAARMEDQLQAIYCEARRRLLGREGFVYRETIVRLAAEAVTHMDGREFVLSLSPADRRALGDDMAPEVARRAGRSPQAVTLTEDSAIADGDSGVIIRDAEGRQAWDNRLSARLDRLWPESRQQVAAGIGLVATPSAAGGGI